MRVKLDTSERIKDLRVEKRLTMEQLAELTGLSSSAIGKYESGEYKDISAFAIAKLADKLGVSTDYLLCRTEQKITQIQSWTLCIWVMMRWMC